MTADVSLRHLVEETAWPLLVAAGVPGAAIAIALDGRPFAIGVGSADRAGAMPLAADAPCYLYSITKLFIAAAALRLAEDGRLDLDAPLGETLPIDGYAAAIPIRRLLDHTAGLPDYGGMREYHDAVRAHPGDPWSGAEFLARTLPRGPLFPPGEGWAYSNIGYLLARLAVERAAGAPLREVLDRLVVASLGLRQTRVGDSLADAHGLTPGFSADLDGPGAVTDVTDRYHPGWVSHGVVRSTAAETVRMLDALVGGELLRPESLAAMGQAVAVPGDHPPFVCAGYGLGVMIDLESPFGRVFGHSGGGPGYATAAYHFPDVAGRRLTVAVLANRDGNAVAQDVAFALAGALAEPSGLG